MGMIHDAVDGKIRFQWKSSNLNGDGKWGEFRLLVLDEDEIERVVSLEKDEMIALAAELLAASELVAE